MLMIAHDLISMQQSQITTEKERLIKGKTKKTKEKPTEDTAPTHPPAIAK
jgi:hypothetical protein